MATHTTPTEPVQLPHEPCIHGMSDANWCALCKSANGDKQATRIIKAFTPKRPKRHFPVAETRH